MSSDEGDYGAPNAVEGTDPAQTDLFEASAPEAHEGAERPEPKPQIDPDAVWRKGYNRGMEKGPERYAKKLGFQSAEELEALVEAVRGGEQDQGEQAEVNSGEEAKFIRQLKKERRDRDQQIQVLQDSLKRYERQAEIALNAEIRSKLVAAGAHGKAVDDLVALLAPSLAWSSDGNEIEVVERGPDGEPMPSRLTVEELIEDQRSNRSYFFAPTTRSGSGSSPADGRSPEGAPSEGYDWRRNIAQWRKRRS